MNRNVCERNNHDVLVKLSQDMKVKMANQTYKNNRKQFRKDFENVVIDYNNEAKGYGKAEILGEFMTAMNKAMDCM